LWVVDTALGQLVRVDPKTGAKRMVAQLKPSLDNLAIDDQDRIFVSNMADNGIQEVDPGTGAAKQLIIGKLALPGGIGVVSDGGKDTIYVADVFAYRTVDGTTGEVSEVARMHADGGTLELGSKSLVQVTGHGKDRKIIATDLNGPVGLVATDDRTVYLTAAFSGQVLRIDLGDGNKAVIAKDLKMPEGIALTPGGKLVVAEVGAKRLVEIDPQSGSMTEIAGNLPIGLVASPGLPPTDIPTGVGVGASGVIYFSSDIENAIYKVVKK
jgi:streptogramin lyase